MFLLCSCCPCIACCFLCYLCEPVTSVASFSSSLSSVPVSSSPIDTHRDQIDSYLLSGLGDLSRDNVVSMSPARLTGFVSHVIEKHGLGADFHQYMARFF